MRTLLVLCALALAAPARGDPAGRYAFRGFGSGEGLGNLAINQISQPPDGLLWVATEDGLYSYDGERFHRLDLQSGLPSNQIFALLPDARGLWVGTARGLARVAGGRVVAPAADGFPAELVNALATTRDGEVWAATDLGVYRQHGSRFELARGWPGGASAALWIGGDGRVIAGRGTDLVASTDGRTWQILGETAGFAHDRIEQVAQTGDGVVWVRSARHLWSCDAMLTCRDRSSELSDVSEIGRMLVDRRGTLWVPTRRGLDHLGDGGRWEHIGSDEGLPARSVLNAFEDREGSLWVAADQLYQLLGRGLWQSYSAQGGFPGDTAWTIARTANGRLLVGTNRGIHHAVGDRWVTLPGTEPYTVQTIADAGTVLYAAGTEARVMRVDSEAGTTQIIGPDASFGASSIGTMLLDSGTLFVGTWNAGLLAMTVEGDRVVWRRQPLPGGDEREDIEQLVRDASGRLWVAGSHGLAVREGDTWRRFTERDGLASRGTAYLLARANGEVCVAYVESFGVTCFRYVSGLTGIRHLTRQSGLASDKIYFLGEDRAERLYIGMGIGVDILDGDRIEYVSTDSGLVGDDCAARAFLVDTNGDVLIGTTRGMSRFAASRYNGPTPAATPVLISVELGGAVAYGGESPRAPEPGTTSMTVRFAVPTFASRERIEHQIRLRPVEEEWRTTDGYEAQYAQLPHGEYVFEVRTRLGNGSHGPITSVPLTIAPTWWQTRGFHALLGVALFGALALAIAWGARWSTARAAKRIVARSEASLHTLIEQSPDAVLVIRDGVLIYVNARTISQLGYDDATELIRHNVVTVIHPDYPSSSLEESGPVTPLGGAAPVREITMIRKDGSPLCVEASVLRVDFGGSPAVVVIARDVTERKALEARLMFSDRMASIGTLAAGIAHEVNNPLAYVKANLDLVAEQLASAPVTASKTFKVAIDDALEGARRVENIIKGLRTFSRGDREQCLPIDIKTTLDLALRMTSNELRHKCQVVRDYRPVPAVLGDESRLGQVFINLLVNAAQSLSACDAERNRIHVSTSTDDRGRAVIEIRDNGCGMTPEVAKRLFEPFFTTKDIGQGTGLGLSICHGTIQSLGGEISVDTTPSVGSTFRIVLPGTAAVTAVTAVTAVAQPAPTPPSIRARVLVVDDDETLRVTVSRMLRHHDVTIAASAEDALAELERGEGFDVILCDIMMPGLTGMDLHDHLKTHLPAQAKQILFMTGGASTPAAQQFLEDPAIRWLEKPFDAAELRRQVLAVALESPRATGALPLETTRRRSAGFAPGRSAQ